MISLEQYNLQGKSVTSKLKLIQSAESCSLPTSARPHQGSFRRIGQGHCGSVWTQAESALALKRADCAQSRYLWKEYYMQTLVLEALTLFPGSIRVPQCYWFTNEFDPWWAQNLPLFEKGAERSRNAMCSERIPPVSRSFQHSLIDKYCSNERLRNEIKASPSADCIARLYLGAHSSTETRPKRLLAFSLRNFPIRLEQAEELNLPIFKYANTMADALAIMHWQAEIDAADVEFVLGSPRKTPKQAICPSAVVAQLRYNTCTRWHDQAFDDYEPGTNDAQHELWLLDFDCCSRISMNDEGVEQAAVAFWGNDPYYPRPCAIDSADYPLWEAFESRYLSTSEAILRRRELEIVLARSFVERVVGLGDLPREERRLMVTRPAVWSLRKSELHKASVPLAEGDQEVASEMLRSYTGTAGLQSQRT